ncbi:MAG TPA: toll/interleukin-1 receptor domain-containing protein, partial [Stellaceae bacterium]|nr:toll/interleukin-1 receptor domain-containing protein [Stellaceae bacterium]
MTTHVFISYSSKDAKVAGTVCEALERRGLKCWISSRDIEPGQNFQQAIVRAIRAARVMVLVFTTNANSSNEIMKEVALAGQYGLTVIPVRTEDVLPNDAFAYEFATRQWIDLFQDWERSIERLAQQIAISNRPNAEPESPAEPVEPPPVKPAAPIR